MAGLTLKEVVKAASLYAEVVILYSYADPSPKPFKLYHASEGIEDGIRTIRIKYRTYEGERSSLSPTTRGLVSALMLPITMAMAVLRHLLHYYTTFVAFRKLVGEGWKPDIIHADIFPAAVPAVLLGKLYRIPVVVTERFSAYALGKLGFFQRMKARFAMNRARVILPVSNALKESIETYGINNRFRVVPNVVNTETFYPQSQRTGNGHTKKILVVASLTPVKGIPFLLQCLAQIKKTRQDFILDLLGDGVMRNDYEELAEELGLREIVKFHGLRPRMEVPVFMRGCDFLVLPSLYETFGAVVIEALASGKPVVGSDVGGISETLNEELGVLAPPGDPIGLARSIEFMLDNYAKYSPEMLSRHAKENFGYEAVGQLLNSIYESLLERKCV